MNQAEALRSHLIELLDWNNAHVNFDSAIEGIPAELRGERPDHLPYSLWQLLEHMRLTQRDILNFCRNPAYKHPKWPDDYWPNSVEPLSPEAWEESIAAFRADRRTLKEMISDPALNLFDKVRQGQEQTYLRQVLLVTEHSAYHLGELVALRRLLEAW